MKRKILFITGTRADFGKLKSIILHASDEYEILIFVTGMHMMARFGLTWNEVRDFKVGTVYPFVNQNASDSMASVLSKTVQGLSDFVIESKPDLIIVHGDRVEALAGALVGTLTSTLVAHIEGGEVSGTVDEIIRHAISKIATFHLVSNQDARNLLLQMGEEPEKIFVVGSPDVDILMSNNLPSIDQVLSHYDIQFTKYAIAILHPVVTEQDFLPAQASDFFHALRQTGDNFVIIQPNNDPGCEVILSELEILKPNSTFRIIPSMRFEYFLTLLKHANFIIGNSSAGVREAPYFGVPCINVGTRQNERVHSKLVINSKFTVEEILESVKGIANILKVPEMNFGIEGCGVRTLNVMRKDEFWKANRQKYFLKRTFLPTNLGSEHN